MCIYTVIINQNAVQLKDEELTKHITISLNGNNVQ